MLDILSRITQEVNSARDLDALSRSSACCDGGLVFLDVTHACLLLIGVAQVAVAVAFGGDACSPA